VKKRGKREDGEGGTERSVHNAAVFERESCEIWVTSASKSGCCCGDGGGLGRAEK